jgi:hypothetical protein
VVPEREREVPYYDKLTSTDLFSMTSCAKYDALHLTYDTNRCYISESVQSVQSDVAFRNSEVEQAK